MWLSRLHQSVTPEFKPKVFAAGQNQGNINHSVAGQSQLPLELFKPYF